VAGVIFRTDQGSEDAAAESRAACARLGIRQSMGRPGSAPATAGSGSRHSTLEWELRSRETFATRNQARAAVAAWIEDCDTVRRHSALGMKSPVAWEQALEEGNAP
jgi:putative transposase